MMRRPDWVPESEIDRRVGLMVAIGLHQRLEQWPLDRPVPDQCAYATALAAEAADLVGVDVDDPHDTDFARVVDFLRELARSYAGRDPRPEVSLSQYRLGAARLAARLLIAAGPGAHQQP